jgi:hypothetical protein
MMSASLIHIIISSFLADFFYFKDLSFMDMLDIGCLVDGLTYAFRAANLDLSGATPTCPTLNY